MRKSSGGGGSPGSKRPTTNRRPRRTGRALEQGSSGKLLEQGMIVGSRLGGLGWRHIEQAAAEGELLLAVAAGEEAEVADAVEVFGQDMEQEAADELFGGEGQGLEAAVMAVVPPTEADLTVLDGEEAVVGDGDAGGCSGRGSRGTWWGPAKGGLA